MSLQRLTEDQFEVITVETHPSRSYVSSSSGVTGSTSVYARQSPYEKEVAPLSTFLTPVFEDSSLEALRLELLELPGPNIETALSSYLSKVNNTQTTARFAAEKHIHRFNPPFRINRDFQTKTMVKKTVYPFYRTINPSYQYAFTNYNCFNFQTGSSYPTDTVLLYPNPRVSPGFDESIYGTTGSFSFNFWIKPTQVPADPSHHYRAGTILHLTGAYALSLVTGSSKDVNGFPDGFRVVLQVSSSAGLLPSAASPGPFVVQSDDNHIRRNQWHHVTVRWGDRYNLGSGSFVVDGQPAGTFSFPTSSIGSTGSLDLGSYRHGDPTVLCVGNFYEGTNAGVNALDRFFARDVSEREGVRELNATLGVNSPTAFSFTHPLAAEVHDLKLFDRYLLDPEIETLRKSGPEVSDRNLKFYVPPFFTEDSPLRENILVTPFQEKEGQTTKPFNVDMAYSVGGMYMSLENFTREMVQGEYPRLWSLTGSVITTTTTEELSANEWLFRTGSNACRQYLVYPNDNGHFYPNYSFLADLSGSVFKNDLGNTNLELISLNEMISMDITTRGLVQDDGEILEGMFGSSPDRIRGQRVGSYAILHRTRDNSSNQVVVLDIPNLFYGERIHPGSFTLTDKSLSGSIGKGITIRDDSFGNLYRADANGPHAKWSSIGNIFYDEGIVIIKAPQLYFLGKEQFEVGFKGHRELHVMKLDLPAEALLHTSSSNPSYVPVSASNNVNERDQKFAYVTNVYVHDENMNIILKTQLAQPIVKKTGDRIVFRPKLDF